MSESDFDTMSDGVITAVANSVPEGVYGIILLSNNNGHVTVRTNFPHGSDNVEAAIYLLREAADNLEKANAGRTTTGTDRRHPHLYQPDAAVPDYGPADPEAD